MKLLKILMILIVLAACSAVQAQPKSSKAVPDDPIYGKLEKGKYQNKFFGFTIDIPSTWVVPPKQDVVAARTVGLGSFSTDDKERDAKLQKANRTDLSLFTATEPSFVSVPAAIISIAAQKQSNQKIKAEAVMDATKTLLLASPKIKLLKDVTYTDVGGKRVPVIELLINIDDETTMTQRLFVMMIKGYAVSVGASSAGPESALRVEKVLTTLKFRTK